MRKFEVPVVEVIEGQMLESVYAASGAEHNTPEQTVQQDDWKVTAEWRNHNSGSHSEVAIIGVHNGVNSGEYITMNFVVNGFALGSIEDSGGMEVSNVTPTGFTITRKNHFNPTERFEFNIQITASDSKYGGSIGKTGEACSCSVICVGYTEG